MWSCVGFCNGNIGLYFCSAYILLLTFSTSIVRFFSFFFSLVKGYLFLPCSVSAGALSLLFCSTYPPFLYISPLLYLLSYPSCYVNTTLIILHGSHYFLSLPLLSKVSCFFFLPPALSLSCRWSSEAFMVLAKTTGITMKCDDTQVAETGASQLIILSWASFLLVCLLLCSTSFCQTTQAQHILPFD